MKQTARKETQDEMRYYARVPPDCVLFMKAESLPLVFNGRTVIITHCDSSVKYDHGCDTSGRNHRALRREYVGI